MIDVENVENNNLSGESKKALDKALFFLTKMDRTKHEIVEKLSKSGYSEDIIESVIDKLIEYGYVNDEDYAKRYLELLIAKGKGKFAVREAMNRKGLAQQLVANTIDEGYSTEKELENASELANKSLSEMISVSAIDVDRKKSREEVEKITAKVNRRLMGRGFSYEVISSVMNEVRERVKNV